MSAKDARTVLVSKEQKKIALVRRERLGIHPALFKEESGVLTSMS